MDELTKTKRMQSGHRGLGTKLVAKMNERLSSATDDGADASFLKHSKMKLSEKLESLGREGHRIDER